MPAIDPLDLKRRAARAAIDGLPDSGVIGLGTGSTAAVFLEELRDAIRAGKQFVGVPTSKATRARAIALGIPLLDDEGPWTIAVTVDGADEVAPDLSLIKGAGGALLREKIVNYASARNIIIIDESKQSPRLGTLRALPIEVIPFGHLMTATHLTRHGMPVLRTHGGVPVHADSGNVIYDLKTASITDAAILDEQLHRIPGVVETGLFLGRADLVIVGTSSGVTRLVR